MLEHSKVLGRNFPLAEGGVPSSEKAVSEFFPRKAPSLAPAPVLPEKDPKEFSLGLSRGWLGLGTQKGDAILSLIPAMCGALVKAETH